MPWLSDTFLALYNAPPDTVLKQVRLFSFTIKVALAGISNRLAEFQ